MKSGQRPKSARLKLLTGNAGHEAVRDLKKQAAKEPDPELVDGVPEPPRKLKAEAKREWDRVASYLSQSRVLACQELSILATYCVLHAHIVRCEQRNELPTAAVLTQYRMLASEFGLTPTSRTRVKTIGSEGETKKGLRAFIG
jgi:phage terminase small subunit